VERDDLFVAQANAFLDGIEGKPTPLCTFEEPCRASSSTKPRSVRRTPIFPSPSYDICAKELRLAMLGMIEGNGHPYSWSAIVNGYDPVEMAECPYPSIIAYMGRQPLESIGIPGARVTHIWTDDPADAPKVRRPA